jgi:phenylacetate-CoA ligase
LTNLIRDLAFKDEKLCQDIFNRTDYVPALFQYNTGTYFMEENNGEVVITTKSTTPLVRYNVHDRGGVIKFREMEQILAKHGYDYKKLLKKRGLPEEIVWQQPFVYCGGRGSDTIIVGGANIVPEQIAPVLFNDKIKDVHSFKVCAKYDEEQHQIFSVLLELKNGKNINSSKLVRIKQRYHDLILKQLQRTNLDFRDAYRIDPKVCDPSVEVFQSGDGPFEQDSGRTKPKLVLR